MIGWLSHMWKMNFNPLPMWAFVFHDRWLHKKGCLFIKTHFYAVFVILNLFRDTLKMGILMLSETIHGAVKVKQENTT